MTWVAFEVQFDQLAVRPSGSVADQPGLADLASPAENQRTSLPRSQPGEEVLCTRSFQMLLIETTRCFGKQGSIITPCRAKHDRDPRAAACATLGTVWRQVRWHVPPITTRSPRPCGKPIEAPPAAGRSRNLRGCPSEIVATIACSMSRAVVRLPVRTPSQYRGPYARCRQT